MMPNHPEDLTAESFSLTASTLSRRSTETAMGIHNKLNRASIIRAMMEGYRKCAKDHGLSLHQLPKMDRVIDGIDFGDFIE
jgi:hypothetical protein